MRWEKITFTPPFYLGHNVTVLRIESYRWPFALVRYAIDDKEASDGIWADFSKLDEEGHILLLDEPQSETVQAAFRESFCVIERLLRKKQ